MAGGKLTPRQKMVNLMYLVFIAMMALNMSKEVLSAFGLMNEKFESVNVFSNEYNDALYKDLEAKAGENAASFAGPFARAKQVKPITDDFYNYLAGVKKEIEGQFEKEKGKLPYEAMDKGDYIDEHWFNGDGYSKKGQEFINTIEKYKADLIAVFGNDVKYQPIIADIKAKFDLSDIKDREGVKKKYLDYHFKGFPAIATIAKLTAMQNDVKKAEQDMYNALVGNTTAKIASVSNYDAVVITEKSAFFQGETVKGKVVLVRSDASTVPDKVIINGAPINLSNALHEGQVDFSVGAGALGNHDITGQFVFTEDGKPVKIDIKGNYAVVPQPKEATISADKMNSVYRGVDNPMTVSFAGVSSNNVNASAPGSFRPSGTPGKYSWNVTSVSGKTAKINVSAKLDDGTTVSSQKEFIVRNIPAPSPSLRGKLNSAKGNKNDLSSSTINVVFEDFVFDLEATVVSFEVFVPGSPIMICQGNRFSAAALAAIGKARKGDVITIGGIVTTIKGSTYKPGRSGNFTWEVQ